MLATSIRMMPVNRVLRVLYWTYPIAPAITFSSSLANIQKLCFAIFHINEDAGQW